MTPPEEVLALIENKRHLLSYIAKQTHASLMISPMEFSSKAKDDPSMWCKETHPEVWGYGIEYILSGIIHAPRLYLRTVEERDRVFEHLKTIMSRFMSYEEGGRIICTRL